MSTGTRVAEPTAGHHHADVGFGATVASEWIKLRTSRGVWRNLLLGGLLGIGLTVLVAVAVGASFDGWNAADVATFEPLQTGLIGTLLTTIFFSAAGVNYVASEYGSRMIRLTFSVTPRRSRVILAKVIAISVATLIAGFIAIFAMLALSQMILGAYGAPNVGVGDGQFWETFLLTTAVAPVFPVLAVLLTFMLRSTAAALSSVLAILFVPAMFGGFLPEWWQKNVLSALPGAATDSVSIGDLMSSDDDLSRGLAAIVLVGWIVVFIVAARAVVERRDP